MSVILVPGADDKRETDVFDQRLENDAFAVIKFQRSSAIWKMTEKVESALQHSQQDWTDDKCRT